MRAPSLLGKALVAALAIGCSSSSASETTTFTTAPYTTVKSEGGLTVEVRTSSADPPARGTVPIELYVTDAAGTPADDLTMVVVPFMPAMGHGASVKPVVKANGGGRYLVSNVNLFMAGRWELRTTFTGKTADHATPTLDVH